MTRTLENLAGAGILVFGDGYRTKSSELSADGIPVLRVADVLQGGIVPSMKDRVSFEHEKRMGVKTSRPSDVLITTKGTVGRAAFVPESFPVHVYSPQLCFLRVTDSEQLDPKWLYQWARSSAFMEQAKSVMGQTDMAPYVSLRDLRKFQIDLPPIAVQRRIAGVLGALDDLFDTNERLLLELDQLSMSLFLDVWDGTSWCEIQDLGKLTMGQSPPGSSLGDEQVGLPFYQGVRDFGSRFPTQRIFTKGSKRQVHQGAILIAVRAPVGETNVALTDVSIGRGLAGLEATDPAIALRALRATSETWDAYQGTGTVFSSINGNELKKARVPLVKDDSLSQMLGVFDEQFKELFLENLQLRRTRDELLPLLMSGKIRVREAEELVKERVG